MDCHRGRVLLLIDPNIASKRPRNRQSEKDSRGPEPTAIEGLANIHRSLEIHKNPEHFKGSFRRAGAALSCFASPKTCLQIPAVALHFSEGISRRPDAMCAAQGASRGMELQVHPRRYETTLSRCRSMSGRTSPWPLYAALPWSDQSRSSCTRTPAAGREASSYPQHPRDLNPASGGNEERSTLPPGSRVLRQTRHNFTAHSFAERLCCSFSRYSEKCNEQKTHGRSPRARRLDAAGRGQPVRSSHPLKSICSGAVST